MGGTRSKSSSSRTSLGCPKGARALDVGCGTSPETINPGVEILDGAIELLPFPDAFFDLVIAIEVLRYLPGPGARDARGRLVSPPRWTAIVTAAPRWSLNAYAALNALMGR
jgi:ubiquinone/menaquinone biosynthesis C-methylase UbiE